MNGKTFSLLYFDSVEGWLKNPFLPFSLAKIVCNRVTSIHCRVSIIITTIIITIIIRSMSKRLAEEARTRRTNRMLIAMVSSICIFTCICICICFLFIFVFIFIFVFVFFCLYLYLSSLNEKASYHQLIGQLVLYGSIWAGWQKSNPEYTQKSSQLLEREKRHVWVYFGQFSEVLGNAKEKANYGKVLDCHSTKWTTFERTFQTGINCQSMQWHVIIFANIFICIWIRFLFYLYLYEYNRMNCR